MKTTRSAKGGFLKPTMARLLASALLTICGGVSAPAFGDDTEIFFQVPENVSLSRPNVLFILDTSASMNETIGFSAYKHTTPYTGACEPNRVYWLPGTVEPTPEQIASCSLNWFGQNWTDEADGSDWFKCKAAENDIIEYGRSQVVGLVQWDAVNSRWAALDVRSPISDRFTECASDSGRHGDGVDTINTRPVKSTRTEPGPWTSNSSNELAYTGQMNNPYVLYSGNYLNCRANSPDCNPDPNDPSATDSKMQVLKDAIWELISTTNAQINIGLMRFDNNGETDENGSGEGGMVVHEIKDISVDTETFYETLFVTSVETNSGDMQIMTPNGPSPLQETLYEAYRYFTGQTAVYGNNSRLAPGVPYPSVPAALPDPKGTYIAPESGQCNKNYIVIISDGTSTQDTGSTSAIESLIGSGYRCDPDLPAGNVSPGPNQGDCLDDLSKYLSEALDITTFTVGFGIEGSKYAEAAEALLFDTAKFANGEFLTARTADELQDKLAGVLGNILKQNTTFTSPTLTVNAFNRTRNLDDLFITVFQPKDRTRWAGNLKKYTVKPPLVNGTEEEIIYSDKDPPEIAIDPQDGFFSDKARSFWTVGFDDGAEVQLGGAANRLPAPTARKLYSNLTGNGNSGDIELASADEATNPNGIMTTNAGITNVDLGLPPDATDEERAALIDWARGADVDDDDGDKDITEQRYEMGDPLHARPASVVYGKSGNPKDAVVYVATNDGYLHAIDPNDGSELWAFVPKELLDRLADLRTNDPLAWDPPTPPTRTYGLDGSIRAYKVDENRNGIVDGSDKVYLFFGMGRGGSNYYALDVTNRNSPELMWVSGPGITESGNTLAGAGQSWSTPVPARVRIGTTDRNVLIFGGGYQPHQDDATEFVPDTEGNRIFMVDIETGNLVWSAGPSGASLNLDEMTSAIPSDVRVVDLTGDGLADRIYAADMGGRVWRFDIFNGTPSVTDLVKGGVFASLGGAQEPTSAASNRRFYYAPDPALISYGGQTWINIAVGSGHRGHPMDTQIDERFYSLRDRYPYTRWGTAPYDSNWKPITDSETDDRLLDVTDSADIAWEDLAGRFGWKLRLAEFGGSDWVGEKVLAESRTFQNTIYFTTFAPKVSPAECGARVGKNRLYVVSAKDAAPVGFADGLPETPTVEDRFRGLGQAGIAPEVVFLFPEPEPGRVVNPQCLVGVVSCGTGLANPPVRTYWRQRTAN